MTRRAKIADAAANLGNTEFRATVVLSGESKDEDGTRAFDASNRALAEVPPERFAGALMVTDGQVHDVPKTLKDRGYDGPLHALITGERDETDRRLIIERAPRFGIVGAAADAHLPGRGQGWSRTARRRR